MFSKYHTELLGSEDKTIKIREIGRLNGDIDLIFEGVGSEGFCCGVLGSKKC